jgi:hypothetical protein
LKSVRVLAQITVQPSAARRRALALPLPIPSPRAPAPVTIATLETSERLGGEPEDGSGVVILFLARGGGREVEGRKRAERGRGDVSQ